MLLLTSALVLSQIAPFQPLNHKALPPSQTDFYFIALGDNRPAGAGLPPTATFRELVKEVSIIDPAFVLSSGDLLYGNEETLDQYKQEIAWMKPLLNTLPCPFFNAPGNHEINNRPEFLAEYTKSMGPLYGEFDYGNFRFLAVCTELPAPKPSVTGDELTWLSGVLSTAKPTITYQHHPVFMRPTNLDKSDAEVDGAAALHALYVQGGVKVAFEAHDHVYNAQVHDGIQYVIAGGAGAPLDTVPTDGGYFNYVLGHVTGDDVQLTVLPMGSVEVTQVSDGVAAVGEYSFNDLPVHNMEIFSTKKPTGLTSGYTTKKGKFKEVPATIVNVVATSKGFETQVDLVAPAHHATFVKLTY